MTVAAWYTSAAVAAGNMTPRPVLPAGNMTPRPVLPAGPVLWSAPASAGPAAVPAARA